MNDQRARDKRALSSQLYRMLHGDQPYDGETLRVLLERLRHRRVTDEDAQRYYDRAAAKWRAAAASRQAARSDRAEEKRKCARCAIRPARPNLKTCEHCNNYAKAKMKASRAKEKENSR